MVATVTGALAATVKPVAVAVRTQPVPLVIVSALKVDTPAVPGPVVVPPTAHPTVAVEIVMVSAEPAPEVTTLPYVSSTEALNVVNATLTVATTGGAVV